MMATIRRDYVDGLWGQVHLRRCGSGPAVVMLHQTSVSGAMFAAGMPHLAAHGFTAIALDTPGYGMSDPPQGLATMTGYAENLLAVLDALGLERAHLIGHHTGAGIAALHAARHPHRIDRLVMQGVPWFDAATIAHFRTAGFQRFTPRLDGGHLIDAWRQRLAISTGWTHLEAMNTHALEMLSKNESYFAGFEAALDLDLEPALRAITCPTLLFTNTGDSAFALSQATHALRPDFAWETRDGGTNDYVDEAPADWADAMARFLRTA
jgi:haloalkane dehalogenase